MTRKILLGFFLLLALVFTAERVEAQYIGTVGLQTGTQAVFTNTNCSGGQTQSAPIINLGQSVHILSYRITGNPASAPTPIVTIEGSFDNVNYSQISDSGIGPTIGSAQSILVAYGSYPYLEAFVNGGTTGCVVNASYIGASVTPANSVGDADITAFQKTITALTPDTPSLNPYEFIPPYGNTAGVISFVTFGGFGVAAGSTLSVYSRDNQLNQQIPLATFKLSSIPDTVQYFVVPSLPTSGLYVVYTSGGSSSGEYAIEYLFSKPGVSNNPQCELSAIINTASAGPTQIIAAIASAAAQVRICSLSVSSGTAEGVDFQQGTGTNCGTGNSQLTGVYHLAANTLGTQNFPEGGLLSLPGNAVCIHLSAGNQTDGTITYSEY